MIAGFIILRLEVFSRKTGQFKSIPKFYYKFRTLQKDVEPVNQNLNKLEGKEKKEFLRGAEIAHIYL